MHRFLRNFKLLSAIGFVVVILLVWFFGYSVGIKTIEARLIAILCIMGLWVVGLLVGRLVAARAGTLVERMFRAQLDQAVMQATPEQRGEVALLRKQLLEAIATLKTSNLGRTRGKAALYELPWYMIIGHPAAGKSSAIQNSGLTFPLEATGKNAIRGVGGTRNCDWFFTTEGVLLDTAGRYSTQREDRGEWLEFLRLLKSHRSRTPVNGILVAISFPELVQFRSEGFAEYARQIRARINEIDQAFSRKVPIYLMFTKIDLLGGFAQFFEDMDESQRSQVWGATLTHEQDADFDAAATIAKEFEDMYRGLSNLGGERLAASRGNLERPALFAFPIEFNAMRNAVVRFVEILFEDDPYHTRPFLRGFYFTSALQEGAPNIPAGARVASRFDLKGDGFPRLKDQSSKSYFLRDLFRDVIFPDQHLVGRQVKSSWNRARWMGLAAGLLVTVGIIGAWTWSYNENRRLINEISDEIALFDSSSLNDRLSRLNLIQVRLQLLAQQQTDSPPVSMRFGLYKGRQLAERLEGLYVKEVTELLVGPVTQEIEGRLGRLSSEVVASEAQKKYTNEQYYDSLKTYLMLAHSEHREAPYLSSQLLEHWHVWLEKNRGRNSMDRLAPTAESVVQYYVQRLTAGSMPAVANQNVLVADSRSYLNGVLQKLPAKERVYSEIISRATGKFPALTLSRVLENSDTDLMAGSHTVPAAFTRAAWDGYVREAIEKASKGGLNDNDWVLESDASQRLRAEDFEKNQTELLAMYKAAYAREWMDFIAGLSINGFRGLDDAVSRVNRLSDIRQSPIRRSFARIAYETAWDNPALMKREVKSADEKNIKSEIVNRLLADNTPASDAALNQLGELEERFSVFNSMTSERNAEPSLAPYLTVLSRIKVRLETIKSSGEPGKAARGFMKGTMESSSELTEGGQIVDGQLLAGADSELRALLKPMLLRPFNASYGALLPLANSDINQNWQRQVLPYWQLLADKYPFAESGTEAQLSDVARFLQSEGGTLNKFINEHLNGLLVRGEHGYTPRRWSNMSVPFTKSFLDMLSRVSDIEEKVFIAGGASRFEIQPVPIPGLSEVILEIDGQQLRYRNGPQLWRAFEWPSESAQGVKISAVTFAGASSTVASKPGRMGWVRLLSEARVTHIAPGTMQLTWTVNSPDSKTGGTMEVKFNLRQIAGANPLAMNTLRKLNLPQKIVN